MGIESASDRAVFVNSDEFGAVGVYTPAGGAASAAFAGQFDRPTLDLAFEGAGAIDARPTFFCAAEDLPGAALGDAGDALVVTGEGSFEVIALKPDGTGMMLIILGKAV